MPQLHQFYYEDGHEIQWVVYTDNAQPVKGKFKMADIPINPK